MAVNKTVPCSNWKDFMVANGIIVEGELLDDGQYHRLASIDIPHHKNVSYLIRTLSSGIRMLFVTNFADHRRDFVLQSADVRSNSKARKELADQKEVMEEKIRKLRREAIERDFKECQNAVPATDANAYLKKKGVHAVAGLRQGADGELIIPLQDSLGNHRGSQRIYTDGSKHFAKDCDAAGSFFKVEGTTDTIGFAEGLATALTIFEVLGCTVYMSCGASNLKAVSSSVSDKHPDSRLVFFADNDIDNNAGNIGIIKAREAAHAAGAAVVYPTSPDGESSVDWNDLFVKYGPEVVFDQVTAGLQQGQFTKVPADFELRECGERPGLYLRATEKHPSLWIAAPLYVTAFARTQESRQWARMLEWRDHDAACHKKLLTNEELARDPVVVLSQLDGYLCDVTRKNDLMRYISMTEPKNRMTLIEQTGWTHDFSAYVLPETTFRSGTCYENIALANAPTVPMHDRAGSFEDWKELMELTVGNHHLTFGLAAAFTGPLLRLTDTEFLCCQFTGRSSCGKTTILQVAASVCGQYTRYTQSWNATANGLEGICKQRNDGLLIIDEQSEADSRSIQETSYMIANGNGKRRARTNGEAREIARWRLTALSSGEVSIGERTAEGGRTPHAGQEVRWLNIPVGLEDVRELHGLLSAQELIDRLKEGCLQHYGHAWNIFLERLVHEAPALSSRLRTEVKEAAARFTAPYPRCSGQIHRVAVRFALCEAAGKLVSEWNILPHSPEDVEKSVSACFTKWIEQRGTTEEDELTASVRRIENFIHQYESRFAEYEHAPSKVIPNIAGYKGTIDEDYCYYEILQSVFTGEILRRNPDQKPSLTLLRQLHEKGLLVRELQNGRERFLLEVTTPSGTKAKVYKIKLPHGVIKDRSDKFDPQEPDDDFGNELIGFDL